MRERLRVGLTFLILVIPGIAQEEPSTDPVSRLRFINGDQLTGNLKSFSPEQVVWQSPILQQPATFWIDKVLDLALPVSNPEHTGDHVATVHLARGDSLKGRLVSVKDGIVMLDTWYAGELAIKRSWIRKIDIDEISKLIYRGPTGLSDWTMAREASSWKYQEGALTSHASGGIAKNFDLPEEFKISFELAWRSNLRFNLSFLTEDIETMRPMEGYEITFNSRSVNFRRCNGSEWLDESVVPSLSEDEKAKIEVRVSQKSGTFCFYVNDQIVDVWKDPAIGEAKLGKGVNFIAQNQSPLRLSNLEISSWNGVVTEQPDPMLDRVRIMGGGDLMESPSDSESGIAAAAEDGRMNLRNGDSMVGDVKSIEDGKITVETPFTEVVLPLVRLKNISLQKVDLEEPKREKGDVRAWFQDGTSIVFRLEELQAGKVVGYSQNFGIAEFDLSAFGKIEFNVYDRDLDSMRIKSDW